MNNQKSLFASLLNFDDIDYQLSVKPNIKVTTNSFLVMHKTLPIIKPKRSGSQKILKERGY
jgi:hypothetical protein